MEILFFYFAIIDEGCPIGILGSSRCDPSGSSGEDYTDTHIQITNRTTGTGSSEFVIVCKKGQAKKAEAGKVTRLKNFTAV